MSVITQFFPSGGGGGGGNETPTGIKIPADGIPVEILGVSGGGGGGQTYAAPGGAGAVFHATNYYVQPGCTVPITIGGGGPAGGCPNGNGSKGGSTCFNYPIIPLSVVGGGGGGSMPGSAQSGCPGGNGGGGSGCNSPWPGVSSNGGCGCYYQTCNYKEVEIYSCSSPSTTGYRNNTAVTMNECTACAIQYPWGIKAGYPGSPGGKHATPYGHMVYNSGLGGASGGNAYTFKCMYEAGQGNPLTEYIRCRSIPESPYRTDIAGSHTEVNDPGTFGYYGSPNSAGSGGGLIIKWSTAFGAAPPTGFPGASDISADTPGYYTYCFTSGGSIELP